MPDPNGAPTRSLSTQARQLTTTGYGGTFYGAGDPLPPITPGQPVRQWDFPVGVNMTQTPRHTEPFNFKHLRAFANVELVRMAIETRKDQLERLDWMVKPKDDKLARKEGRDARCIEVEKFLHKPDGVTLFQPFFRAVEDDLLSLDAPVIECRRTRGGKLIGLEYVDGATINLLVDNTGRRPRGPDEAAFQQIIKGVVWANLTNRDLIYSPRNVRTGHIYGFGPVEQIIVTINTIIRRQGSQLAYFTEGNVPQGILNAPEGWTLEQIRDLQEWFDQKISGNAGAQRSVIWTPNDSKYQSFKEAPIKDEFDEWLARLVAFAFSLPPTPFIRQMNKGTAGEDQERSLEEGLEPLKLWRKRLIDSLIEDEFGYDDLEFVFKVEKDLDPRVQMEADDKAIRNGSATIDEVRDGRGQDPLPNGAGAVARVYMSDGAMTLDLIDAAAEVKANPPPPPPVVAAPPTPTQPGETAPAPAKKPAAAAAPGKKKVQKLAKVKPPKEAEQLSVDRRGVSKIEKTLIEKLKDGFSHAQEFISDKLDEWLSQQNSGRQDLGEALNLIDIVDLADVLNMHEPLLAGLEEAALDIAPKALASVGVESASQLVDQVSEAAVAWARQHAADLVSLDGEESLVLSTRNMIRDVIANGLENNVGKDQIVADLKAATAFSDSRAELIGHTEIAFANSAGKQAAWNALKSEGVTMLKEWFVSGEQGVCDECQGNEDEGEINYDAQFSSGDDFEPAHPACRCVVTVRVVNYDGSDEGEG